jgi:putative peptide zinc metalloprotease protein
MRPETQRRKQIRVEMRRDLVIVPQEYHGRAYYVIKDPVRLRYLRLNEAEHFILRQLDGRRTLDEVRHEFEQRFPPRRLRLEEVESYAHRLINEGLAHPSSARPSLQLLERRKEDRSHAWQNTIANLLAVRIPLCDPDRLLGWLGRHVNFFFLPPALLAGAGFVFLALLLAITHFSQLCARLPGASHFFSLATITHLWIAVAVVKVLHELGHGLSCKAFGGEVHEMGFMLLCLAPCLYCDVSDSWTISSKWRRMFVGFAGMYVELLIAAAATFMWWFTTDSMLINRLCLSLMIVCSVNTLMLNGNPLLRYDGYYVLSDWLEMPNLHARARRILGRLLLTNGLGIPTSDEDRNHSLLQRLGLGGFAAASAVYRWVATLGAAWVLYQFLKPYHLEKLVIPAAGLAIVLSAGFGLHGMVMAAFRHGRFSDMDAPRFLFGSSLVAVAVAAFCSVPLPIGHIRQTGLVQFHPDAADPVYVPCPSVLVQVHVREGQQVAAGELLAEFRSIELENAYAEEQATQDVHEARLGYFEHLAGTDPNLEERARAEAQAALLRGERPRASRKAQGKDGLVKRLQIRAPRAGIVVGLPPADEIGQFWEKYRQKPFCTIGNPSRLWVVIPLAATDYHRVREDWDHGRTAEVALRVPGRTGRTFSCRLARLPEDEAEEIPEALSARCGGPVVTYGDDAHARPECQQFLAAAEILSPDRAIRPGVLAPVVVRCQWRTGAWWLWQTLAAAFDLGLA